MDKLLRGRVHVFGDHVDTDMIIPSAYLITGDEKELGAHAFEQTRPGFAASVTAGDILVAGRNFGCGSSREHAPLAIRGAGIACIVAESFARTFYRNCINRGFPLIELADAPRCLRAGDEAQIDIGLSSVTNVTTGESWTIAPLPDFVLEIWRLGGLKGYIQKRLDDERAAREEAHQ